MAHAYYTPDVARALALASVACEVTPVAGTGAFASRVVVRPEPDEVAEFPGLRGVLGAERPGWRLNLLQTEYVGRPKAGDRLTTANGSTYQLREVESDRLGLRWLCRGFPVVEEATDELLPQIYMPCGLGFSAAGSLL